MQTAEVIIIFGSHSTCDTDGSKDYWMLSMLSESDQGAF